jgi:hypothetical protein
MAQRDRVMSQRYKSAADALAESPVAALIAQARLLERLSSIINDANREAGSSPAALPLLRVALQGRTVVITAGNPSQAAKLRQRAVALRQAVVERVPEVTGIRIRLQPGESADPVPVTRSPTDSRAPTGSVHSPESLSAALGFAEDLARHLHDSALRRSAERLQALLRTRLERGK